uniref:Uncharacterized protein LOC114348386 n=1 Tax=Diabrotica virgifera virgifera TaxID=50390 RepID=A0A6P7H872_DIAVI
MPTTRSKSKENKKQEEHLEQEEHIEQEDIFETTIMASEKQKLSGIDKLLQLMQLQSQKMEENQRETKQAMDEAKRTMDKNQEETKRAIDETQQKMGQKWMTIHTKQNKQ